MMYYIKERHNPQLGVYYVAYGQIPAKQAKEYESSLYGTNYMLKFNTEKEYRSKLQELSENGNRIQYYEASTQKAEGE
jgi:hypothetical protein